MELAIEAIKVFDKISKSVAECGSMSTFDKFSRSFDKIVQAIMEGVY